MTRQEVKELIDAYMRGTPLDEVLYKGGGIGLGKRYYFTKKGAQKGEKKSSAHWAKRGPVGIAARAATKPARLAVSGPMNLGRKIATAGTRVARKAATKGAKTVAKAATFPARRLYKGAKAHISHEIDRHKK